MDERLALPEASAVVRAATSRRPKPRNWTPSAMRGRPPSAPAAVVETEGEAHATDDSAVCSLDFVHWTPAHLAWDLLAFLILGAICLRRRWLFASVVIATAMTVSTFLLVFCPEVAMYRGLSSIDSALWMWAVFIIGERRVGLALTLLSLFIGKVMIESAGRRSRRKAIRSHICTSPGIVTRPVHAM